MADATLTLNEMLALPATGFPQQILTAGVPDDELNALKTRVSSALKGMPWGDLEETVCSRLSDLLKQDPMELISSAWEKYRVLADAAEQSKSGETVFVPLAEHSITSDLHPYVEIHLGAEIIRKIEFDVTITLQLKGLVLKIEEEKIKSVEAGSCEGSGEIQVKNISLWKHDFKPIDLPGRVKLGSGIAIH